MKAVGGALIFLAEIGAFVAFGWWGFATFDGALEWVVGVGLPLAVAVLWGTFLSPRATVPLDLTVAQTVRVAILLAGAIAFYYVDQPVLALAQGVVVLAGSKWGDPVPGRVGGA